MTPDERRMLADLAGKITQTPAPPKDPEAEDFIRTKIGSRPDALYLMTQTVIIQNIALQQAQQQIQELRSSGGAQIASSSSGFLGQQQPRGAGYGQAGPGYAAPPPQYAAQSPAPGPGAAASGAPSFLRGAAQTAAGVAAGALAFEGIQSLFSHSGFGGGGGGGGVFGGGGVGGYGAPVEETVVNNYYDDNEGGDRGRDVSDSRDDYQATDDPANVDDSQSDDSGSDDNSGGGDTFS